MRNQLRSNKKSQAKEINLSTPIPITWCPGCSNFAILNAVKQAIADLLGEGFKKENFVLVSGIGCHGKIVDYLQLNSFYALHGRVLPVAQGIKLANPALHVLGFAGDGDMYNEGIAHLVHAAKRNSDITLIVHNNQIFALTTGQFTATTFKQVKTKTSPQGNIEDALNPCLIALISGASFVARAYALDESLSDLIKEAIKHRGFSFIDVLQPCLSFGFPYDWYKQRIIKVKNKKLSNLQEAIKLASNPFAIGLFYKVKKQVFEDHF